MPRSRGRERKEGGDSRLRRENKKLRQVVKRLQSQIEKKSAEPLELDDDPEPTETAPAPAGPSCPLCGSSNVSSYTTPTGRQRWGCRSCRKWRG